MKTTKKNHYTKPLVLLSFIIFFMNLFPSHLRADDSYKAPLVILDTTGDAIITWVEGDSVMAAYRPIRTGIWSGPVTVSGSLKGSANQQLVTNGQGDVVVVWQAIHPVSGNYFLYSSMLVLGDTWSPPASISSESAGQLTLQNVAMNATGTVVTTWTAYNTRSGLYDIYAAAATFGSDWGPPTLVYAP